eukprot:TRINITY_DN2454_c0_g2_i1.p2 TRINITY_DN2454_c0_g2~~TRINITY_DN2454_c0_g2_i1.p2  ORF type:complete len:227 (-),score=39.64 TRINITY_DN2454_c0_g2_i1:330-1010(-)
MAASLSSCRAMTGLSANLKLSSFSAPNRSARPGNGQLSAVPVIRSELDRDTITQIKRAVDRTKVDLTADDVKRNMAENESEKQSVFGTKPVSGGTYPRPELERRPETGRRDIGSLMAFDGPGPETINGRLAMIGAAWAVISEITTGQRIVDQVNYLGSPGLFWFLATIQILAAASLIPLFQGESPDSRRNGPFTAKAERWNGRLAMVGFAGLLLTEAFTMMPVFHL